MNEFNINLQPSTEAKDKFKITIENTLEGNYLYKYMIGLDGNWEVLKDFSNIMEAEWEPHLNGTYMIMVQAKKEESTKPFDYISKVEYVMGESNTKPITVIDLSKNVLYLGEKLTITVHSNKEGLLFKFYVIDGENWVLLRDYSPNNVIEYIVKNDGTQFILVQCKSIDSENVYDYEEKVQFEVIKYNIPQIYDFKCLSEDIIVDKELIFEVSAQYDDNRTVLYKFIKMNWKGETQCIQNFSTKKMVAFLEKVPGNYKILCLLKDMYSQKEYDDIAVFNYKVKPYKDIKILNFTTDLSSPQTIKTPIVFKTIVEGGRDVQYRYMIYGEEVLDSGYKRNNSYEWKPINPGIYKIKLLVKDSSFDGEFQDSMETEYVIEEGSRGLVEIEDIFMDKSDKLLINEPIKVSVTAKGGIDLRYSFAIYNKGKKIEATEYSKDNWVIFIPEKEGKYEIDICIKDKYSNKEFDCHETREIEVFKFLPGNIEQILLAPRQYYLPEDNIFIQVITQHTRAILLKYEINIDGRQAESTEYGRKDKFLLVPRCSGQYEIVVYSKNEKSDKDYDSKKSVKFVVLESPPITNTKLICSTGEINYGQPVEFSVKCDGGRDILYQFFIMFNDEWSMVQNYSKKSYYSFMPLSKGKYKILALCKSSFKKCEYEGYDIFQFEIK